MYQANINDGAELEYALFDQMWLLLAANQQNNPNQQVGNSINCLFSRLRCRLRAQILMYFLYIAVFRAVLPYTHKKIQINRDAQGFNQSAIN